MIMIRAADQKMLSMKLPENKFQIRQNWQTGYIKISQPSNDTGSLWERTSVTQLSKSADDAYTETLGLPKYNNRDKISAINDSRASCPPVMSKKK